VRPECNLAPTGKINLNYSCGLYEELIDHALNCSLPWSMTGYAAFNGDWEGINVYNIPDVLNPEVPLDASVFLNNNVTRAAIHAPTKTWVAFTSLPFGGDGRDNSADPVVFLTDLAANTSAHNMKLVFYSGNKHSLVNHWGTKVVIQNFTFGGIQGFTQKPSMILFDNEHNNIGIIHQERGVVYALFAHAGHQVPLFHPVQVSAQSQ